MDKEILFAELCARAPQPPKSWQPKGTVPVPDKRPEGEPADWQEQWRKETGGVIPAKYASEGDRAVHFAVAVWWNKKREAAMAYNAALRTASMAEWRVQYANDVLAATEANPCA